jgi:hypothetical protein
MPRDHSGKVQEAAFDMSNQARHSGIHLDYPHFIQEDERQPVGVAAEDAEGSPR